MSLDRKAPKGYRKAPVTEYRCQFCGHAYPVKRWESCGDRCPACSKEFDPAWIPSCEELAR